MEPADTICVLVAKLGVDGQHSTENEKQQDLYDSQTYCQHLEGNIVKHLCGTAGVKMKLGNKKGSTCECLRLLGTVVGNLGIHAVPLNADCEQLTIDGSEERKRMVQMEKGGERVRTKEKKTKRVFFCPGKSVFFETKSV